MQPLDTTNGKALLKLHRYTPKYRSKRDRLQYVHRAENEYILNGSDGRQPPVGRCAVFPYFLKSRKVRAPTRNGRIYREKFIQLARYVVNTECRRNN